MLEMPLAKCWQTPIRQTEIAEREIESENLLCAPGPHGPIRLRAMKLQVHIASAGKDMQ